MWVFTDACLSKVCLNKIYLIMQDWLGSGCFDGGDKKTRMLVREGES